MGKYKIERRENKDRERERQTELQASIEIIHWKMKTTFDIETDRK